VAGILLLNKRLSGVLASPFVKEVLDIGFVNEVFEVLLEFRAIPGQALFEELIKHMF